MARESYTPGATQNAVTFMTRRRGATHAAFFVARLKPGMRVLDVGCGPGSITLDLARKVAPGGVIGVDRTDEQFAAAIEQARAARLDARFEAASVYDLPFPDASFDAAFAHALFEHLAEPPRALAELHRILKPGGVIGLRSPDWGGFVVHPETPALAVAIHRYESMQHGNGGDTHAGRKLVGWLREAGFTQTVPSASYEIYPDNALIGEYLALQLERAGIADAAATLRSWMRLPDAIFAQAWFEALGVRD